MITIWKYEDHYVLQRFDGQVTISESEVADYIDMWADEIGIFEMAAHGAKDYNHAEEMLEDYIDWLWGELEAGNHINLW